MVGGSVGASASGIAISCISSLTVVPQIGIGIGIGIGYWRDNLFVQICKCSASLLSIQTILASCCLSCLFVSLFFFFFFFFVLQWTEILFFCSVHNGH